MKKIICIVLAMVMLLLNSCSTTLTVAPTPDATGTVDRPAHASDEYLIIQAPSLESWFVHDLENVKGYGEYDIIIGLTLYNFENETAPQREGYTYEHTEYFKEVNSQEDLPLDEIHDFYTDDNKTVAYIRGSDKIVEYYETCDCSGTTLKKEERQAAVESFLSERLGDEVFSLYCQTDFEEGNADMLFTYTRYLGGYTTTDEIEVNVCKCGKITKYKMPQVNRYNNAKEEISRRRVEYCYEQLKAKVDAMDINVTNYGEPKIVLSNTGEYFIEVSVTHIDTVSEYRTEDREVSFKVYYKY